MARTPQDLNDTLDSPVHSQSFYLKTEDENGPIPATAADRLYVNIKVPVVDADGILATSKKVTVNVNDALVAQGLTGAQRQAFLDGLKALAAYCKAV